MSRYFFHLDNGEPHPDGEGEELPDDDAARRKALLIMHETMRGQDAHILSGGAWSVRVVNAQGGDICALTLKATLPELRSAS